MPPYNTHDSTIREKHRRIRGIEVKSGTTRGGHHRPLQPGEKARVKANDLSDERADGSFFVQHGDSLLDSPERGHGLESCYYYWDNFWDGFGERVWDPIFRYMHPAMAAHYWEDLGF